MDRIDLHVEVTPLPLEDLSTEEQSEKSEIIRARVIETRNIQTQRYESIKDTHCNAQISSKGLKQRP